MNFFRASLVFSIKRPFLLAYTFALSLIYAVIQIFNPLYAIIRGFDDMIASSWGEVIIYVARSFYSLSFLPYLVLIVFLSAIIISAFSGLISSCYMNGLYAMVRNKKFRMKMFWDGIKKYFLRTWLIFFEFYIVLFSFFALIPLALIPSIIIADRAIINQNENIITTVGLPALTGFILFVSLVFIVTGFVYRFPASYFFRVKPIEKSKAVLNNFYWRNFGKNALFLLLYLMMSYLIFNIENSAGEFFANFFFYGLFIYLFGVSIFQSFHDMLECYKS